MNGIDANSMKWQIIEVVSEYLREHFHDEADKLETRFTSAYELALDVSKSDESTKLHRLIKEFKPALNSILQPGLHFDRLMGLVSPILNDALAYLECTVSSRLECGDHWLVYAVVDDGKVLQPTGMTAVHYRKSGSYY